MEKILLDTNMFIYLEDYAVIEDKVATLTKRLFDSDQYKIVIHPKTKEEILKIQDKEKRNIFSSKISVYKEIKSPPKLNDKFNKLVMDLNDLKRVSKVNISNYTLLFDSAVSVNNYIIDEVMDNKEVNPNYINIIRTLDLDICNKILNKLKDYDYTICKLMPKKNDE